MFLVIKKGWKRVGETVFGGRNESKETLEIDRIEDTVEGIKQGEYYVELKIK